MVKRSLSCVVLVGVLAWGRPHAAAQEPEKPCVDRDDRWATHNTTCARMRLLCEDGGYGPLVRSWCPRSCGLCNATADDSLFAPGRGPTLDFGNQSIDSDTPPANLTTTTSTCPAKAHASPFPSPAGQLSGKRGLTPSRRSKGETVGEVILANTTSIAPDTVNTSNRTVLEDLTMVPTMNASEIMGVNLSSASVKSSISYPPKVNAAAEAKLHNHTFPQVSAQVLEFVLPHGKGALPAAAGTEVSGFRREPPADFVYGLPGDEDADLFDDAGADQLEPHMGQWASAAAALAVWAVPDEELENVSDMDDDEDFEVADLRAFYDAPFGSPAASPVFEMLEESFFPGPCAMRKEGAAADLPMGDSPYTLEAWVMPDEDIGHGGIVGWGDWGVAGAAQALRFAGSRRLKNNWWGNALVAETDFDLADGEYHHVAATWDGTVRRIFVDFEEVARQTTSGYGVSHKDNFCVGRTNENEQFRGRIKDLKIWRVARSAAQLQAASGGEFDENASRSGDSGTASDLDLTLEGGNATAAQERPRRCPVGFERLLGDVYGGDQFSGGYSSFASSMEDCARKCAFTPGCGSFEFSPSSKRCFRNSQTRPTHDEQRSDFVFCRRAPCPSLKTEEACVGPSVAKKGHTEEVGMRPGSYCIWSGGVCQAPMACTDADCFLPDGGLPGMDLPPSKTLWISREGLQATMGTAAAGVSSTTGPGPSMSTWLR